MKQKYRHFGYFVALLLSTSLALTATAAEPTATLVKIEGTVLIDLGQGQGKQPGQQGMALFPDSQIITEGQSSAVIAPKNACDIRINANDSHTLGGPFEDPIAVLRDIEGTIMVDSGSGPQVATPNMSLKINDRVVSIQDSRARIAYKTGCDTFVADDWSVVINDPSGCCCCLGNSYNELNNEPIATLTDIEGEVLVDTGSGTQLAQAGMRLRYDDLVLTQMDASAMMRYDNACDLRLGANNRHTTGRRDRREDTIATLTQVLRNSENAEVFVMRHVTGEAEETRLEGFEDMPLQVGDRVLTLEDADVLVEYLDTCDIRLVGNNELVVRDGSECCLGIVAVVPGGPIAPPVPPAPAVPAVTAVTPAVTAPVATAATAATVPSLAGIVVPAAVGVAAVVGVVISVAEADDPQPLSPE